MQEGIRRNLVDLFADVATTEDNMVCVVISHFAMYNFINCNYVEQCLSFTMSSPNKLGIKHCPVSINPSYQSVVNPFLT